jgi:hypothetical protein
MVREGIERAIQELRYAGASIIAKMQIFGGV